MRDEALSPPLRRCSGSSPKGELGAVEVGVLGSVLIHLLKRHGVAEEGIPADGEVHPARRGVLGLGVEGPVEPVDGVVELSGQPGPGRNGFRPGAPRC